MSEVLAEILRTQRVHTRDGKTLTLHSHIPPFEGRLIQGWIRHFRPRTLLEIGLAYGISALHICAALGDWKEVSYHIIDPHQSTHWHSVGLSNLDRAGYQGRYHFHEEPSELCLPQMVAQGIKIDFALIDGFHTFDQALVDFFFVNRLLNVGGIVLFDDVHLPSIQKVIAHVASYPCYETLPLPNTLDQSPQARLRRLAGVAVSRVAGFVKVMTDERNFQWYVDF